MPFVISDDFPNTVVQPTEFEVFIDGATIPVPSVPAINPATGLKFFKYDLSTLSNGQHTIKVRTRSAGGDSVDSAPFTYTKLANPLPPLNLRYSDT